VKVVVLTGGVGGARFLRGIVDAIDPAAVTAVVNVGDDLEVLGLSVSPDLDSVLYALAGVSDEERGWGRADETWNALASVEALGGESWFRLGDRDLGLHVVRTHALRTGAPLSGVTERLAAALGVDTTIARGSTRRTAASPFRSGSSRAHTATRSTARASRARLRRDLRPGCSKHFMTQT
jgi:LPPG:FO 2-phospho-L-lactate transferase